MAPYSPEKEKGGANAPHIFGKQLTIQLIGATFDRCIVSQSPEQRTRASDEKFLWHTAASTSFPQSMRHLPVPFLPLWVKSKHCCLDLIFLRTDFA